MLGKSFTLGDISQRCKAKTSLFPGREDVGESKTDASSCVPFDHAENTHPPANDTLTTCVFLIDRLLIPSQEVIKRTHLRLL